MNAFSIKLCSFGERILDERRSGSSDFACAYREHRLHAGAFRQPVLVTVQERRGCTAIRRKDCCDENAQSQERKATMGCGGFVVERARNFAVEVDLYPGCRLATTP